MKLLQFYFVYIAQILWKQERYRIILFQNILQQISLWCYVYYFP